MHVVRKLCYIHLKRNKIEKTLEIISKKNRTLNNIVLCQKRKRTNCPGNKTFVRRKEKIDRQIDEQTEKFRTFTIFS